MIPFDSPPLDPSGSEGRRWLEEELQNPRYDVEPGLWERFWTWLTGLIGTTGPPLPAWVFVVVILVALLVIAAIVFAVVRPEARAKRSGSGDGVLDERGVDAAAYRRRAKDAQREGDWQTAALDAYRAIVAGAVERTILDELPGRTAREASLALAPAFPDDAAQIDAAARRFDAIRYGHDPATAEDAETIIALDERLLRSRPRLEALT